MFRVGLITVFLFALLAAPGAPAGSLQGADRIAAPQQEEEAPEIPEYPGEQEPDCE